MLPIVAMSVMSLRVSAGMALVRRFGLRVRVEAVRAITLITLPLRSVQTQSVRAIVRVRGLRDPPARCAVVIVPNAPSRPRLKRMSDTD